MIRIIKKHMRWMEFPSFKKQGLIHGVFLRNEDGDEPREKDIAWALDLDYVAIADQKHHTDAALISIDSLQKGVCGIGEYDALITKDRGVGIAIQHADCQAALFYDRRKGVIAAAHAGWRGSAKNIYESVVQRLKSEFHSNPEDLQVCISPSLGPNHAEFIHYKTELPEEFYPYQIKPFYFDFWAISTMQLLKLGLKKEQIEIAGICTYANPDDFFSYRRDKTKKRHVTVIAMA